MIVWGINALNHGSSLAVFQNDLLLSNKFDKSDELLFETVDDALKIGKPETIYWYERPLLKKTRQLYAGQWRRAFDLSVLPKQYLKTLGFDNTKIKYTPHHASHAAAGYYTSPFNDCVVVVLDAIGEWECATIWQGKNNELKKLWSRSYPNSLGLFYSAFTDLIGYQPILEEHKLQKDSALGNPNLYEKTLRSYIDETLILKKNLHKGVTDWPYIIIDRNRKHVAAAVQSAFEIQIEKIMDLAKELAGSDNLVYMGGCAMNSFANKKIVEKKFKHIWSLPQPGDPSSSIGAVLYHTKQRLTNLDLGLVKQIEVRV